HLAVDVFYVRLAFIIGSFLSGLGVAVYAGLWVFSKASEDVALPPRERELSRSTYLLLALLGGAGFVASASLVYGLPSATRVPLLVAGVGAVLAWQAYDRGLGSGRNHLSIVGGGLLMLAGIVVTIFYAERSGGFAAAILAVL